MQRDGPRTQPIDQRREFTRQDPAVTAFVTWSPTRRFKGPTQARIYDEDNRLVADTKPHQLSLRTGDLVLTSWQCTPRSTGYFRVDVPMGDEVAWRGYFRVVD